MVKFPLNWRIYLKQVKNIKIQFKKYKVFFIEKKNGINANIINSFKMGGLSK